MGQVQQKGSSRAPNTAAGLVLECAFSQESQVVLGAVVPSSAMQNKAKFMASTCLKIQCLLQFLLPGCKAGHSSVQCFPRLRLFGSWWPRKAFSGGFEGHAQAPPALTTGGLDLGDLGA